MHSEFEFLVVKTLHILSRKLARGVRMDKINSNFARSSEVSDVAQASADALGKIVPQASIPGSELRGGGLQILPSDGARGPETWWIFVRAAARPDGPASAFAPVGGIEATLPVSQFVATAYQFILGRNVDFDGLQKYGQLIETGRLSRQNFLKALVNSEEAQHRNLQILIVPAPTRRLRSDALSAEGTSKPHPFMTPTSDRSLDSEVLSDAVITLKFN